MTHDRLKRCASCGERAPAAAAYCQSCGASTGRAARLAATAARLCVGALVVVAAVLANVVLASIHERFSGSWKPLASYLDVVSSIGWLALPLSAGIGAASWVHAVGASRLASRACCALGVGAIAALALAAASRLDVGLLSALRLATVLVAALACATIAFPALGRLAAREPIARLARSCADREPLGRFAAAIVLIWLVVVIAPWLVLWILAGATAVAMAAQLAGSREAPMRAASPGQEGP